MLKKVLSIVLSALICAAMCVCGVAEESAQVTLYYPSYLQESEGEALVLDQMPERIVCLSNAALQILVRCGIQPVAVTEPTASVEYPDWVYDLPVISTSMSSLDTEAIIAMEPDLLIVGSYQKETYGQQFADAGIPVYYVDAGHTVPYDSIKMQTEALVNAFGADSEAGAAMLQRFDDLEARLEDVRAQLEGKTVMVLQSSPPTHYIQTSAGTLGSMAEMIGLTNVYENDASSMVQLDYETALSYNPDLVLCVGMSETGEGHRELMEADFANNPEYWNSIPAIANGDVLYLPVRFVSSAGINVVDNIGELADLVLSHFAQ